MDNDKDILLVEDNPFDIKLTMKAFEKINLSHRVYVAHDGEEALNFIFTIIDKKLLKVALLDLKLPKVSGLEVLKEVKSNPKTKILPVVILTSSQEERDLIRSYNLGANSFIGKPVDYDKFIQAVSEIGIYWTFFNKLPDELLFE